MANPYGRESFDLKIKNLVSYHDFYASIFNILQQEEKSINQCIYFHTCANFSFSGGDINEVAYKHGAYHVKINFTGLIGANGTLPLYLREALIKAPHEKYKNYMALYELLQQKSIQHLYQSWAQRRPVADMLDKKKSSMHQLLKSLSGKNNYAHYVTHFSNFRRSKKALAQMLSEILDINVKVSNIYGSWQILQPEQRTYLKSSKGLRLGHNTICGEKIWSFQSKARIILGPIAANTVKDFLYNQEKFILIKDFLLHYSTDFLIWDFQLLIDSNEIIPCCLKPNAWNQLGLTSFLGKPMQHDINTDIHFEVDPHA